MCGGNWSCSECEGVDEGKRNWNFLIHFLVYPGQIAKRRQIELLVCYPATLSRPIFSDGLFRKKCNFVNAKE
jgi:hypothetical protein